MGGEKDKRVYGKRKEEQMDLVKLMKRKITYK